VVIEAVKGGAAADVTAGNLELSFLNGEGRRVGAPLLLSSSQKSLPD
jgi:hypothetical protein